MVGGDLMQRCVFGGGGGGELVRRYVLLGGGGGGGFVWVIALLLGVN